MPLAGIIAMLLGFSPKVGAIIFSVPAGVLAGVTVALYGLIGLIGVKIWIDHKVDFSKPIKTAAVDTRPGEFNDWTYSMGVVYAGMLLASDVTGDARYIYHGNDGTSMPWNDTAQLNYLNPAVREAVIQTILEVARRFPIIRFDAAMTLT